MIRRPPRSTRTDTLFPYTNALPIFHDAFVEKLTAATNKLQVAPGNEKGAEIGPLIDDKAVAKVREHIADAVSHGARVVTGGASHALGGRFFTPTLITGVTQDMAVAREETLGPLAPVFRFETEDEIGRAHV